MALEVVIPSDRGISSDGSASLLSAEYHSVVIPSDRGISSDLEDIIVAAILKKGRNPL